MTIEKEQAGSKLTITLAGRLDTGSAPELEREVRGIEDEITELVFDMRELAYIASAGLRILLLAQKNMNRKGSMLVRNAGETIMDVFKITGFSGVLNIE